MADTLITRLSHIRELSIRPTRDVMRYEDGQQDIAEAGRALGADAILDGSIQRVGDRVRVTVRLIHTASKSPIWAAQLDEKFTDIFAVQDAISEQLARALSLNLSDAEQQLIKKNYTADVEAYQAYLKGRYFWNKRTKEYLDKTIEHFEQAIRISPDYALAYAGLADAYSTHAFLARTAARREELYKLSKKAALTAIEIDKNLAEAHASLGLILRNSGWDWVESEKALKRAIELNPNYPTAHRYYALLLATVGRLDEAIREGASLSETAGGEDPIFTMAILGYGYAVAGQRDKAEQMVEKLLALTDQISPALVQAATICAGLGDKDRAFELLEKALALRDDRLLTIKVDPRFDSLRADERYHNLLRRMNLPQ
jgi:tetratricopeptide (TPR) repeat protein